MFRSPVAPQLARRISKPGSGLWKSDSAAAVHRAGSISSLALSQTHSPDSLAQRLHPTPPAVTMYLMPTREICWPWLRAAAIRILRRATEKQTTRRFDKTRAAPDTERIRKIARLAERRFELLSAAGTDAC